MIKVLFRVKDDSVLPAIKVLRQAYPGLAPMFTIKEAHAAVKQGWFETDAQHLEAVLNNLRPFVTGLRSNQQDGMDLDVALRRIRGVLVRVVARGVSPVALFLENLETRFFG